MTNLARDIRHSVRFLSKNPAFSAIAISALALGIGANTAIFSVIHTVLLKPLPYEEASRLIRVVRSFRNGNGNSISVPKYMAWKRYSQVFESITAYDFAGPGMNLAGIDKPEVIKGIHVSAGYFPVFRAKPAAGRFFTEEEDRPGGPLHAVLSYALWQRRYGGDPGLVGKTIQLNDDIFVVTGIMGPSFIAYPPADVWLPLQADPNSTNQGHYLNVTARLKPGVSLESAKAHLKIVGEQARRAIPLWVGNDEESVTVVALQDDLTGDIRNALFILMGAVGLVLLIACANVANLLLARAAARQREIAVRIAIGAGRWQLVRQLLTESALLSLCGGALGLLIGVWGVRALIGVMPGELPRAAELTSLHPWIVAFTLGVSLVTAILFGLFPALKISRPDLASTLKESASRSGTSLRHNRARSLLAIAETALAVVLVIGAVLLIRSFASLRNTNPGFDTRNLLTMKISLAGSKYKKTAPVENLFRQTVQRVEALPGVVSAAPAISIPPEDSADMPFTIEGRPTTDGPYHGDEQWRNVGPHYFSVLNLKVLRGRAFNDRDTAGSMPVVVINEALAKKYWKNDNPVGQRIAIGRGLGPQFAEPARQIAGIVSDVREGGLNNPPIPVIYIPIGQTTDGMNELLNAVLPMSLIVRTTGPVNSLSRAIERELQSVDGQLALTRIRAFEAVISDATARQSFNMLLLGIFSSVALLLAAIGIYGLMSHSVEQRTQEIGIRMALGADQNRMVAMIVRQGALLAVLGVGAGLAAAFGLTRLLRSMLFGVQPNDIPTFGGVAVLLTAVAVAASFIPARRAAKIDPVCALRCE